jgi:hypothetical protein
MYRPPNGVLEHFRSLRFYFALLGILCVLGIVLTLFNNPQYSPWRKKAVASVTERRGSSNDMLILYTYDVDEKTYTGSYKREYKGRSGRRRGGRWTGGPERWPGQTVVCYYRPNMPGNSVVDQENPMVFFVLGAIVCGTVWVWASFNYREQVEQEEHWVCQQVTRHSMRAY